MKNNILISLVTVSVAFFTACNQAADEIILPVEQETVVSDNPFAVSIDEAEQTLMEILAQSQKQATRAGVPVKERRIKNRYTSGGNSTITRSADGEEIVVEHPVVHIFNFENNEGFAVIGGDKRATPLLALTDDGELTPGMRTGNLGMIMALQRAEAVYMSQLYSVWDTVMTSIEGVFLRTETIHMVTYPASGHMCQVEWHQYSPYNAYCQIYGSNTPTGCVPTAVAQAMSIFQYPPYYGYFTFNWNSMIAGSENNGVAQLMFALGMSDNLNVNYGPTASGASMSNVPRTFMNFGYANNVSYLDYNTSTVMSELVNGHPVIISGKCHQHHYVYDPLGVLIYYDYEQVGHAWLGDGAQYITNRIVFVNLTDGSILDSGDVTGEYVHCNFGWGPDPNPDTHWNGFYLSGSFTPSSSIDENTVSGYHFVDYTDQIYLPATLKMVVNIGL